LSDLLRDVDKKSLTSILPTTHSSAHVSLPPNKVMSMKLHSAIAIPQCHTTGVFTYKPSFAVRPLFDQAWWNSIKVTCTW